MVAQGMYVKCIDRRCFEWGENRQIQGRPRVFGVLDGVRAIWGQTTRGELNIPISGSWHQHDRL